MYVPRANRVDDEDEIRAMVAAARTAWLITAGADRVPAATLLPVVWRGDTVYAHFARANPHVAAIEADRPALLVVTGPDAYVSPSWYASKREHGRVVPTWNYTSVQLTGTVRLHDDPEWLRDVVTDLTARHEGSREHPWHVDDAPEAYVEGQLRGIVGVEFTVRDVEGKAKLSQNKSDADQRGVVAGLRSEPFARTDDVADAMENQRALKD